VFLRFSFSRESARERDEIERWCEYRYLCLCVCACLCGVMLVLANHRPMGPRKNKNIKDEGNELEHMFLSFLLFHFHVTLRL
jgi:hypothetical protein